MEKIINEAKGSLKHDQILHKIPHSYISCPNLTTTPTIVQNYRPKEFYTTNPVPLHLENVPALPTDIFSNIVLQKDQWSAKIEMFKKQYRRCKGVIKLQQNDPIITDGYMPKYLSEFCTILNADPDCYFNGTYNWYFSGGNLDSFENGDKQIVLHTTGPEQNILNISSLNFNQPLEDRKLVKEFTEYKDDTIFEIIFKNNLIYTRHKHNIYINQLHFTDSSINIKTVHSNKFTVPLTSIAINEQTPHQYCTIDMKRSFKVCDFNSKKQHTLNIDFDKSSIDNWSYITFVNSDLLYVDRQNIALIDFRCTAPMKFTNSVCLDCDYYSMALPSIQMKNNIYLSSNHSVYLLDVRNTKTSVTKWTHMMHSVPFLMRSLINLDYYEMLTLSSPLAQDKTLILNGTHDVIASTPLALKSMDNTLKLANLKGQCLHPESLIRGRVRFSTTGLSMFKFNRMHYLLSQSALGDLFIQKFDEHPLDNDDVFSYQSKKIVSKKPKHPKTLPPFRCISLEHLLKKRRGRMPTKKQRPLKEVWRRSVETLKTYNDVLAPLLLQTWGYITDGEIYGNGIEAPTTTNDKVTSWLADVNFNDTTMDMFPTSQETMDTFNFVGTQPSTQQSTQNHSPVKKGVKRKRISGF